MTEKRKLERAQNIKPSPHKKKTTTTHPKNSRNPPPTVQTISQKPVTMKNILYCPKTCQQRDLGGCCPPHSTEKASVQWVSFSIISQTFATSIQIEATEK